MRIARWQAVVIEAAVVAVMGVVLALAVNQLSPRGLSLGRDYFPNGNGSVTASAPATTTPQRALKAGAGAETGHTGLAAQLEASGLQLLTLEAVKALYEDPRHAQGAIVFVDARDDRSYQAGHIPGAYQYDRYQRQADLGELLPPCLAAEHVVVYCSGGECEDSTFAALTLAEAGVERARLGVYGGGVTEWRSHGYPLELGSRLSGVITNASPQ